MEAYLRSTAAVFGHGFNFYNNSDRISIFLQQNQIVFFTDIVSNINTVTFKDFCVVNQKYTSYRSYAHFYQGNVCNALCLTKITSDVTSETTSSNSDNSCPQKRVNHFFGPQFEYTTSIADVLQVPCKTSNNVKREINIF